MNQPRTKSRWTQHELAILLAARELGISFDVISTVRPLALFTYRSADMSAATALHHKPHRQGVLVSVLPPSQGHRWCNADPSGY